MAGFTWAGSIDGSEPILRTFTVKASAVISRGEMCNLESGEADAGATNDDAFIGPATESVDNTVDGHTVECIVNAGAIYSVVDANARVAGDLLDLASGGMGVTTSSNNEFKVWADSSATEPTLVIWTGHTAFGWS
jgi:hypothetical protein